MATISHETYLELLNQFTQARSSEEHTRLLERNICHIMHWNPADDDYLTYVQDIVSADSRPLVQLLAAMLDSENITVDPPTAVAPRYSLVQLMKAWAWWSRFSEGENLGTHYLSQELCRDVPVFYDWINTYRNNAERLYWKEEPLQLATDRIINQALAGGLVL